LSTHTTKQKKSDTSHGLNRTEDEQLYERVR
jgi:hypothetical protein